MTTTSSASGPRSAPGTGGGVASRSCGMRFYEMHLTIPGQMDVMGVGIGTYPMVSIGFNKDVAWSHTVSTANALRSTK